MTLKQNHPLQNLKKNDTPHPSPYQSQYQPEKRYKDIISNADNTSLTHATFHLDMKRFYSILTVRSLVCPWKPLFFLFVFSPFVLYRQLICDSVGSDKRLKLLFIQNGVSNRNTGAALLFTGTFFTCLRALGKYSSLQLTLKTIAQTTALRQKEVNYFHR